MGSGPSKPTTTTAPTPAPIVPQSAPGGPALQGVEGNIYLPFVYSGENFTGVGKSVSIGDQGWAFFTDFPIKSMQIPAGYSAIFDNELGTPFAKTFQAGSYPTLLPHPPMQSVQFLRNFPTTTTAPIVSQQQAPAVTSAPSVTFPVYTAQEVRFVQGMDSPGNDIPPQLANLANNGPELVKACLSNNSCVAVNTNGWLKNQVVPDAQMVKFSNIPGQGTYVIDQEVVVYSRLLDMLIAQAPSLDVIKTYFPQQIGDLVLSAARQYAQQARVNAINYARSLGFAKLGSSGNVSLPIAKWFNILAHQANPKIPIFFPDAQSVTPTTGAQVTTAAAKKRQDMYLYMTIFFTLVGVGALLLYRSKKRKDGQ